MAQGDVTFYNVLKKLLWTAGVDVENDTIKIALVGGYTLDIDSHDYFDDVSSAEISASGYTAGGATITVSAPTQDNTNNRGVIDFGDVTWTSLATATINGAIIYKSTGTASTSPLIAHVAISTNSNGANYSLVWNATGFAVIT